jgi:hypothetical protein
VHVKRPNYFTHQLLLEQDFKDEQNYHVEMRRRLNRLFHTWGILEGLEVNKKGEREIAITPGVALDRDGREIVLLAPATRDLSAWSRDSHAFVTVAYDEGWHDEDHHSAGGVEGYTRVSEIPKINEEKAQPNKDGAVITLARVYINEPGHVHRIDMDASIRKSAVPASPGAGWVRLPFKPARMGKKSSGAIKIEEEPFIIDEATAHSDARGARGSMAIPVPPGAKRIVGFRVAGETRGTVTVSLHRTGWNPRANKGEKTELVMEIVQGETFHKDIAVESNLDESHTLAVAIVAQGESTIWLVAAKFE